MTAAGLYKRIYYLIMPTPKVHGHVTNENGAIACIIEFDNGFLMNIIVHDQGRPEKLRGPGQRVKVGPFTQVVR